MEVTHDARQRGPNDPSDPSDPSDPAGPLDPISPGDLSVSALIKLLQETHHAWLRKELPPMLAQAERAADSFGEELCGLHELVLHLRGFCEEILIHLEKEEQILFELAPRLEAIGSPGAFRRGSVESPIQAMLSDHLIANRALAQIREIRNGLTARLDSPPPVRELCRMLGELDSNMRRHIHLEDEVLFPKIRRLEATLFPRETPGDSMPSHRGP